MCFDTTDLGSNEVQISTLAAPDGAYVGDTLTFTADIQSNTDTGITLSLYDNTELIQTLNQPGAFDGSTKSYVLTQTDPGVYTASIKTGQFGVYKLMITQTDADESIVDYLETAIAVSYSSEYDAFAASGEPLLNTLCSYTDGELYADMEKLSNVQVSSISILFNPMGLFCIIAAILMLCDIAMRKLRRKDIRNYLITRKHK